MELQLPITERDFEDARPYKTQTVTCNQKRTRQQKMKAKEVEAQKRRRAEANMTKQVSKSNEIKIVMPLQIPPVGGSRTSTNHPECIS